MSNQRRSSSLSPGKLSAFLDQALKSKLPLRKSFEMAGLDPAFHLIGASLCGRDFRGQNLDGFDFFNADLRGADFRRAKIDGASFIGANTKGAVGLPDPLSVFFSYAWLDAKEEHAIQEDFFERLKSKLAHPPKEFAGLPAIDLWRDKNDLRATDRGDVQITNACKKAFLGLLMLSDRYPYREICRLEANFFIDTARLSNARKTYLSIGVNVDHTEVPSVYTRNLRQVMPARVGLNLVTLWSSPRVDDRLLFLKEVSREIFMAARTFSSNSTAQPK